MSSKKQLLAQIDIHNVLFNNVLADISEDEANAKLVPGINTIKWLAGHLLWAQTNLARDCGLPIAIEWTDHYNNQLPHPPGPEIREPSLLEIKEAWNQHAPAIREKLASLTDDILNKPFKFPLPQFNTVEGLWAFINHHQAYTIGQIGILRRGLGKEAMSYL
jgi:hypothetical protein